MTLLDRTMNVCGVLHGPSTAPTAASHSDAVRSTRQPGVAVATRDVEAGGGVAPGDDEAVQFDVVALRIRDARPVELHRISGGVGDRGRGSKTGRGIECSGLALALPRDRWLSVQAGRGHRRRR